MDEPHLITERLELVPATLELAQADLADRDRFASLLKAQVPGDWPPPLVDAHSMGWTAHYLEQNPDAVGWANWYVLLKEDRMAVGNVGFKGKPDVEGTVETGYSILEAYHRRGYAPEAVNALLVWAFEHSEVQRIAAETFPLFTPSIRVLRKTGFKFVGVGNEKGTIRFELTREEFANLFRK